MKFTVNRGTKIPNRTDFSVFKSFGITNTDVNIGMGFMPTPLIGVGIKR